MLDPTQLQGGFYPPLTTPVAPTPPQGLPGQTPVAQQNALAAAMRARGQQKKPFASILAKPPAPAAPAPDPLAKPQASVDAANAQLQSDNANAYTPQPVNYQAPTEQKDAKIRSVIDAIGTALLRKSPVGNQIGKETQARNDEYKKVYADQQKIAAEDYDRREQAEQDKANRSDRKISTDERALQIATTGLDSAASTQQRAQAAQLKAQQVKDAQKITEMRTRAQVARWAAETENDQKRLTETAKRDADQYQLGNSRIAEQKQLTAMRDSAMLARAGMSQQTAFSLANRRYQLDMGLESMREIDRNNNHTQDRQLKAQIAQTTGLLRSYQSIITAAGSPTASPAVQAQAQALLAPGKNGVSPFDTAIAGMRGLGINATPSSLLAEGSQQASEFETATTASFNAAGDPAPASGAGGVTVNVNGPAPGAQGDANLRSNVAPAGGPSLPGDRSASEPGPSAAAAQYMPLVQTAATVNGVRPGFLAQIISGESTWNPKAIGRDKNGVPKAYGIAQFTPDTAAQYGVDVNDPQSSITGAAMYLHDLQARYHGSELWAAAAYNAGPGAADAAYHGKGFSALDPAVQQYALNAQGMAPGSGGSVAPGHDGSLQRTAARPTARTGVPGRAPNPQPPQPPQVPPQAIAANVLKKYESDQNYAGRPFDEVWPEIKQQMLAAKATPQDIAAVEPLVKPKIDASYAAHVKNKKDADAMAFFKSQHPGVPDNVAQQQIAANPSLYQQGKAPQSLVGNGVPQLAPAQFAQQTLARFKGMDGQLQPGAMQQVVQALQQRYKMAPDVAQKLAQQAMGQPQQVAGAR